MQQKNRTYFDIKSFSIRYQAVLDYKQLKPVDLCKNFGLSSGNLSEIKHLKHAPGANTLAALIVNFPDINARWLITGEGNMIETSNVRESRPKYNQKVLNERAERICAFVVDWMETRSPDEQAWLEIELKNRILQYEKFLSERPDL